MAINNHKNIRAKRILTQSLQNVFCLGACATLLQVPAAMAMVNDNLEKVFLSGQLTAAIETVLENHTLNQIPSPIKDFKASNPDANLHVRNKKPNPEIVKRQKKWNVEGWNIAAFGPRMASVLRKIFMKKGMKKIANNFDVNLTLVNNWESGHLKGDAGGAVKNIVCGVLSQNRAEGFLLDAWHPQNENDLQQKLAAANNEPQLQELLRKANMKNMNFNEEDESIETEMQFLKICGNLAGKNNWKPEDLEQQIELSNLETQDLEALQNLKKWEGEYINIKLDEFKDSQQQDNPNDFLRASQKWMGERLPRVTEEHAKKFDIAHLADTEQQSKWFLRLHKDHYLVNFGFSKELSEFLKKQEGNVGWAFGRLPTFMSDVFMPQGCLADEINLIYVMMGEGSAVMDENGNRYEIKDESQVIKKLNDFLALLDDDDAKRRANLKNLWIPGMLIEDNEVDDQHTLVLLEYVREQVGYSEEKLLVIKQLPTATKLSPMLRKNIKEASQMTDEELQDHYNNLKDKYVRTIGKHTNLEIVDDVASMNARALSMVTMAIRPAKSTSPKEADVRGLTSQFTRRGQPPHISLRLSTRRNTGSRNKLTPPDTGSELTPIECSRPPRRFFLFLGSVVAVAALVLVGVWLAAGDDEMHSDSESDSDSDSDSSASAVWGVVKRTRHSAVP